jgi:hypothetical protein
MSASSITNAFFRKRLSPNKHWAWSMPKTSVYITPEYLLGLKPKAAHSAPKPLALAQISSWHAP